MKKRPVTTLFMLSSIDGKISTGNSMDLDVDKDFPKFDGLKEGLHQYYELEQMTDLWSFNSGFVQAKMGVNEKPYPEKGPVSYVIVDNKNLKEHGVNYLCHLADNFVLITSNKNHPAYSVKGDNLHIIYQDRLNLREILKELYEKFSCERITIQTGGTLNGLFLREKLFDYVNIVYAPALIGGKDTASLIDGPSIENTDELGKIGVLHLESCDILEDSYIRLKYKVIG